MCTLVEHKHVLHNYRQWNNENLLKRFESVKRMNPFPDLPFFGYKG